MTDLTIDPLALGQRVVAVLETGLRTATYKLATLMALVDHCVEYLPDNPADELAIPIKKLAERVLETYWRQVAPLQGFGQLRQSSQPNARVLRAVQRLRDEAAASHIASPAVARERLQPAYRSAIADIALTLAQQPLHRLQRVTGAATGPTFLYDDSWLHDHVSWRTINENGGAITLYPGVASGLARLSGLLKPTLEILWIQDVVKLNTGLADEGQDVAGHLFGRERISLQPVRSALLDAFGAKCFYCGAGLGPSSPVDHVLPWSRVAIDGLANLVPACERCNSDKSNALPAVETVTRVLGRDRSVLDQIGLQVGWPVQYERVCRAARGLYRGSPEGAPTWQSRRTFTPLDRRFAEVPWIEYQFRHATNVPVTPIAGARVADGVADLSQVGQTTASPERR
jgi:5-methylcytosine-specific restriction endonuclease McrA